MKFPVIMRITYDGEIEPVQHTLDCQKELEQMLCITTDPHSLATSYTIYEPVATADKIVRWEGLS